MTSPGSGRRTATTTAGTPGRSSDIGPTDARPNARCRAEGARPMADRDSHPDQGGDPDGEVVHDRAPDVDGAPPGPALRRPAHRARRLPRPALLLDRLVPAGRG